MIVETFKCQTGNNQEETKRYYNVSKSAYILDIPYNMETGSFDPWRLYSETEEYKGNTVEELRSLIPDLINRLSLKKEMKSKRKNPDIDAILIFIDNLLKVEDIFNGMITDHVQHGDELIRAIVCDHFIFQKIWGKDMLLEKHSALKVMQGVMNMWFIPDKHLYTTVSSIDRVRLGKLSKGGTINNIKDLYPKKFDDWLRQRECLLSPIRYQSGSSLAHENMLAIDINSAYIYALMAFKHCASLTQPVSPLDWRQYLNRTDKGSFGRYVISYSTCRNFIRTFQTSKLDEKGNRIPFEAGKDQTVYAMLNNVDLDVLLSMKGVYIQDIQCMNLWEFDMDYAPDYYRECIKKGYLDKQNCIKGTVEYDLVKEKLNAGVFGNTIMKTPLLMYESAIKCGKTAAEAHKIASKTLLTMSKQGTLPAWGIWAISYTRKIILELGQNLTGWCYSNTDSIYCCDTEENREFIKEYNQKAEQRVRKYCEQFGEDFNKFSKLGQFEITELSLFRAWDKSTYAYLEKGDDVPVVKASGVKLKEDFTIKEIFEDDAPKPKGELWPQGYLEDGHYREHMVNAEEMYLRRKALT
jgi:hypothetical protein